MVEAAKAASATQEQPVYPPPPVQVPYPGPYAGGYPPPPPGASPYPPYFAYPPAPADGAHTENGQNGVPPGPYMMFGPPGVVYYPQPPQGQAFPAPPISASVTGAGKPKRKQVKMACTNCAAACKRCDEARPCERCQKYGIAESCVDGQRKERKKGIKRGPYKRKNKSGSESEWTPPGTQGPTTQPAANSASAPPIHAVPQFGPPPEGYYPALIYPPPYMPHPPDGSAPAEGSPPHPAPPGQPPMMPYYIHPGGYPHPYAHYPMYPPHMAPPPPGQAQSATPSVQNGTQEPPQTVNPSDTPKKGDETNGTDANGKKRPRNSKGSGDPKSKRAKTARNGKDKDEDGVADSPSPEATGPPA